MDEKLLILIHAQEESGLCFSAEVVSAAKQIVQNLGGRASFDIGFIGTNVSDYAKHFASCGAERFFAVSGKSFEAARYESDAAAAEAIFKVSNPTIILAAGTSRCLRYFSGLALRLGGRVDTHVVGISAGADGVNVSRWFYRQRIEAKLSRNIRPWFIAIDQGNFNIWQGNVGEAKVENVSVDVELSNEVEVLGTHQPNSDEQTIRPDAQLLFVAGAGWTKKQADGNTHLEEAAKIIRTFLNKTQSSLGSSKSLVDIDSEGQGVLPFLSHLNQVGQTGSTPRHPKGLATCCHGEEPHTVGWRFIKERRAINLNPNCGWAQGKADILYVADAYEVMKKVNELFDA